MTRPYARWSALGIVVEVELPELDEDHDGELTTEMRDRAVEALRQALPESVEVHLDGPNKPAAIVRFDPWCVDEEEAWEING